MYDGNDVVSVEFVSWAGDVVFSGLIVDNSNIAAMAASTCFSSPPSSSSKCNEDSFINSEENITDDNKIDESSFESFSLGSDIISCQSVEDSDISETASENDDDDDSDYVNSNSEEDDDDCSWVDESLLDVSDNEIASLMRDTNEVIKLERDAKEDQQNDILSVNMNINILLQLLAVSVVMRNCKRVSLQMGRDMDVVTLMSRLTHAWTIDTTTMSM